MQVSIIVPNYNHAQFLQQRLDTILQQTYQNFELIILDDCSTDNSAAILEKYRTHSKVSAIIYNEKNSGSVFKQWQKGIAMAKGELVWIAESDDWCENNFLETLVNGFLQNRNCVLAYAQSYCVDEQDKVLWQSQNSLMEECVTGEEFFNQRLSFGCTIFNASMAVFKKEFALLVPETYTSFKMCGDWLFWINLIKYGDIFISGKLLNYFRKHTANLSSKQFESGNNFIEELRVIEMVKAQKRFSTDLFNRVVYNKYNNYLHKKKRFTTAIIENINRAFYELYDNHYSFQRFIFFMRMKAKFKKLIIRFNIFFLDKRIALK